MTEINDIVTSDLQSDFKIDTFKQIARPAFLLRLQLMSGKSKVVEKGLIPPGVYGLLGSGDDVTNIGKTVDALVISWRPKAMRFDGDDVLQYYNVESAEFKAIVNESKNQDSGCMYGPEYLCWLPVHRELVTFFMGSATARNESSKLYTIMSNSKPPMATLDSRVIESGKYTWLGPVIKPCSTPPVSLPDVTMLREEAAKFNNPHDSEIEKASPATAPEARPQ